MEFDWGHASELITRIVMMAMIVGLIIRVDKLEKQANKAAPDGKGN